MCYAYIHTRMRALLDHVFYLHFCCYSSILFVLVSMHFRLYGIVRMLMVFFGLVFFLGHRSSDDNRSAIPPTQADIHHIFRKRVL